MGVGIYYFYHWFGLKAFEGRHIRTHNIQLGITKKSLFYFVNIKTQLICIVSDQNPFSWVMHDNLYKKKTVMISWNGDHLEKYGRHFEFHVANRVFRISCP